MLINIIVLKLPELLKIQIMFHGNLCSVQVAVQAAWNQLITVNALEYIWEECEGELLYIVYAAPLIFVGNYDHHGHNHTWHSQYTENTYS